jgi:hypothetical protein
MSLNTKYTPKVKKCKIPQLNFGFAGFAITFDLIKIEASNFNKNVRLDDLYSSLMID